MKKLAFAVLGALFSLSTAGAEEAPKQASGTFASRAWTLELVGAYAFPADEVGFDDQPGYKVVVSNRGFVASWLDKYESREYYIDNRFRNDEDFVVYFHFDRQGAYKGMTYYFESGDGCGFCMSSKTTSTVKVEKGRIAGRLALPQEDDDAHFDLQFDVPIAPTDHGKALPAGGGDPGKIYAAFHKALVDFDTDAVVANLTADNAERFTGDKAKALDLWRSEHPTENYKIVKGWVDGDFALLLVEGANSFMKMNLDVLLEKEKGVWKVSDELTQPKFGE
jgi:hypothetical protein